MFPPTPFLLSLAILAGCPSKPEPRLLVKGDACCLEPYSGSQAEGVVWFLEGKRLKCPTSNVRLCLRYKPQVSSSVHWITATGPYAGFIERDDGLVQVSPKRGRSTVERAMADVTTAKAR